MARRFSPEWWSELRPEVAGKETEKLVGVVFDELNQSSSFAHHRFPDAKAARGALKAQPSDSLLVWNGVPIFLEIKALKHLYRLPSDRVTQLPVLKKFALAGAQGWVLVNHYMIQRWRIVSVDDLTFGVPSWDLSSVETFDGPKDAILHMAEKLGVTTLR